MLGDNADEMNAQYSAQDRELELERRRAEIKAGETKDVLDAEGKQKAELMNKANMFELLRMDKEHGNRLATIFAENDYDWKKIQHNEDFQKEMATRTHDLANAGITFKLDAEAKASIKAIRDKAAMEIKSDDPVAISNKVAQTLTEEGEKQKLEREGLSTKNALIKAETTKAQNEAKQPINLGSGIHIDRDTGATVSVSPYMGTELDKFGSLITKRVPNPFPVARIPMGALASPGSVNPTATMPAAADPSTAQAPQPTAPAPEPVQQLPQPNTNQNALPNINATQTPPVNLHGLLLRDPNGPTLVNPGILSGMFGSDPMDVLHQAAQTNPTVLKHMQKIIGEIALPTPQVP
jgi:hypothetical protein